MRIIVIDYETYYDDVYSLRKMTVPEYILDPRFECFGAAIKDGNAPAVWYDADDLPAFFASLPEKVTLISHNALFDGCITAWIYNYVPSLTIDTLGMARAMLAAYLRSLSLDSVAAYLGIGVKGKTIHKVSGYHMHDIMQAGLWEEYTDYARNDAELCALVFTKLMKQGFPKSELYIMDMVMRCAFEPKFFLDSTKLAEHLWTVQNAKQNLLDRCGLQSRDDLMSNDKFAGALITLGITPPRKTSPVTGKETWAFAKTDPEFIDLEEHENPEVQALVCARLGLKSTLEETRTQRLLTLSHVTYAGIGTGAMPIPLRYSGAHTHRLSGDWKLNLQNLPRGGKLRESLIAPLGYKVVAVDASQIEARIVAWFCAQLDLLQQFADGEDVYSSFASKVFNRVVTKKADPVARFIGKTAILGLGYGLGWPKFQKTVKMQSKSQLGSEVGMSDWDAKRVVDTYRTAYLNIPGMWNALDKVISAMARKDTDMTFGPDDGLMIPLRVQFEKIILPNGLALHYHDLHNDNGWQYTYGGKKKYLYGGKLLENIVQALARIIVMNVAARLQREGLKLALQVHDELVYIVPDAEVEELKERLVREMSMPVSWALSLPLAAECDYGQNYGEAK